MVLCWSSLVSMCTMCLLVVVYVYLFYLRVLSLQSRYGAVDTSSAFSETH